MLQAYELHAAASPPAMSQEELQDLAVGCLRLILLVAEVDGHSTPEELEFAAVIVEKLLGQAVTRQELNEALPQITKQNRLETWEGTLAVICGTLLQTEEARMVGAICAAITMLCDSNYAQGSQEEQAFHAICQAFGLEQYTEDILQQARQHFARPGNHEDPGHGDQQGYGDQGYSENQGYDDQGGGDQGQGW